MKAAVKYGLIGLFLLCMPWPIGAQFNTDRIISIGRNALYFEDYVLSIQYFNQVIKLKPYLAEPYLYRAIAKIQLSDLSGAESDCTMAIKNNPFLPGSYYTRGYIYRQQQQYEKADSDFTKALSYSPENKTYTILRADVRAKMKDFEGARADIELLLHKEPHSASLHFEKGTIALAEEDTIIAFQSFSKAINYDAHNPVNWSARGFINFAMHNEDDALLDFNRAIELGSKWSGDFMNRGLLYYNKQNYTGALADYNKAIELQPNNSSCYYNRGVLKAELGDFNQALSDLDRAIELAPEQKDMYYQRGLVYLKLRQWYAAQQDFDTIIASYPYFLPAYSAAAIAVKAMGNIKQSAIYQQQAYELAQQKEKLQQIQNTKIAQNHPPKKDRHKQFSAKMAQNISEPTEDQEKGYSEVRGSVQKRTIDIMSEPNMSLTYYAQHSHLRQTNYFYWRVDTYNKQNFLPAALKLATKEIPLTEDLIASHFLMINQLSSELDMGSASGDMYFARAIEFALVQDYSSAIDDCTKALRRDSSLYLVIFCRANWRLKLLEVEMANLTNINQLAMKKFHEKFELILRDYDAVIIDCPDFSAAFYNKANMLCMSKNYQEAILCYSRAIELDSDFAEAYFNRGLTYFYTDQVDKGIADLSKAGELGIYQAYNLITRFQ